MRRRMVLLATGLVVLATSVGAVVGAHRPNVVRQSLAEGLARVATPTSSPSTKAAQRSPQSASAAVTVLAPDAQVRFELVYPTCGVRREGVGPVPVGLVGQDRRQVARALGDDVISGFTPDLLVVERQYPGCPGDTVTLVERGGLVVVLAGRPGDTGKVIRSTDIPVRALSPVDIRKLEAGLSVAAGKAGDEVRRLSLEAGVVSSGAPPGPPS